jgi:hypothetical protein
MSRGQIASPWQWQEESNNKTFGTIPDDSGVLGTITYDPEHSGRARHPYIARMWSMSGLGGTLIVQAPCKSIRGAKVYLAWFYRYSAWKEVQQ